MCDTHVCVCVCVHVYQKLVPNGSRLMYKAPSWLTLLLDVVGQIAEWPWPRSTKGLFRCRYSTYVSGYHTINPLMPNGYKCTYVYFIFKVQLL